MSEQNEWIDIQDKKPDQLEVDLKLRDGSTLMWCLTQSDGNFYWKGMLYEVFIDKYHVLSWRPDRSE